MKKVILLLLSVVFLWNCEKNVIGDFEELPQEGIDYTVATKKGVAFTSRKRAWSFKTSDMKAHWMYSWGSDLREEIPANVEFIPMFWGRNSVDTENLDQVRALIAEGKVNYVLGFNEPDGANQANMNVDEAIELWPELESLGVPLGSPATVNPTNAWMQEFMQRAEDLGLRIDFVTVHHYGGINATAFINKLRETYEAYNRPIWITEFAVADWSATEPENNRYSEAEVIGFMEEVLPALDAIEWIQRYAWFDGQNAPLATSALFDDEDNLTNLGQVYANHKPNENIGPGQETEYIPPVDENELFTNGGFETGTIEPWGGFKNDVVTSSTAEPHTGNFCARVQNGDGSIFYQLEVEAGQSYTLRFWSKWLDAPANGFTPVIRDQGAGAVLHRLDPVSVSTDWVETVYEFDVPAGTTLLRFVWFKGQGFPPFFLDDVSLKMN